LQRPGDTLQLNSIKVNENCQVSLEGLPGNAKPLQWHTRSGSLLIETPQRMLDEADRTSCNAWVIKITGFNPDANA